MTKTVAALMLVSTFSMADFIGGELNVGYYNHTPSGTITYQGDPLDTEDDLHWGSEGDVFVKAYFEHPLPILPNIKVGYTSFGHEGSGVVATSFQFAGQNYGLNTPIDTKFDMDMYDITLYYEILDNWLNADVGVNVKYIDGSISVQGQSLLGNVLDETTEFQVPVPMLYAKARVDVPSTDLSFQVEGNYVSYDGNRLYDAEAGVRYTLALGVGAEVGYKTMKLKLDDVDDTSMDTTYSGAYAKLVWDF